MAQATLQQKTIRVPPAQQNFSAANANLLSSLKPIKKTTQERAAEVKENARLKDFHAAFFELAKIIKEHPFSEQYVDTVLPGRLSSVAFHMYNERNLSDVLAVYEKILPSVKSLNPTSSDIGLFLLSMIEKRYTFEFHECMGLFVSALVNSMKEDSITIDLSIYEPPGWRGWFHCIGFANCKNLAILGPEVGAGSGSYSQSGTLTIQGHANRSSASFMKGGIIEIQGGFIEEIGAGMEGGTLILHRPQYEMNGFPARGLCRDATGGTLKLYDPQIPHYKIDRAPYKALLESCKKKSVTGVKVYLNDRLVHKAPPYVEKPNDSGASNPT